MASRVPKFSVEELQKAIQGPDIGGAISTGLNAYNSQRTLEESIADKKSEQAKRLAEIQKIVEGIKAEKAQKEKEQQFAGTLQGPVVANIGGQEVKASETQALAPQYPLAPISKAFPKETAESLLKIQEQKAKPNEPTKMQRLGLLKTGQTVSYNPETGQNTLETGEVYNPAKHGQILREQAPQLSPDLTKDLLQISDSVQNLNRAKSEYKSSFTGPVQSRLLALYDKTGINLTNADPTDATKFRISAATALNDYIRQVTGAQLSANEENRIRKALANVTGPDETFSPAIDTAISIAQDKLKKRLSFYESQGYRGISEAGSILNPGGSTPTTTENSGFKVIGRRPSVGK